MRAPMSTTAALPRPGAFAWKRRMGVHEAYHRSFANRVLHWICIPLELWAVVKLLSLVHIAGPVDLALVVIVVVSPVYLATEAFLGTLMLAFLAGCWWSAGRVFIGAPVWGGAASVALFALTFGVQVLVGHRVFERGRDDTEKNLAEFARTKNPAPLLLVFYYHLVEIALGAGYRPALRRDIAAFTAREVATFQPHDQTVASSSVSVGGGLPG
jgi:uncharacterized membrane protein YGL010W